MWAVETIGRIDARTSTQAFLLDGFLEGFLHKLFVQKWQRFGRAIHIALRVFELLYLSALLTLTMWLKEWPEDCLENGRWLPVCVLAAAVPMVEEDFRSLILAWRKLRTNILSSEAEEPGGQVSKPLAAPKAHNSVSADLFQLLQWANAHLLPVKFTGCAVGCGASVALLCGFVPHAVPLASSGALATTATAAISDSRVPFWTILALSVSIGFHVFFSGLLVPYQRTGVFFRTSFRVISHDVSVFLVMYAIFFCTFGVPTYISYPRVGSHEIGYFPNFNGFLSSLHELNELAVLGEPSTYTLKGGEPSNAAGWYDLVRRASIGEELPAHEEIAPQEWFELVAFVVCYYCYLITTIVLLLNLLIAMMNHTFISSQQASVLEWRVMFARNLLKLEMLAEAFQRAGWCETHGGERAPNGKCYMFNRVHDESAYGGAAGQDDYAQAEVGFFGARSVSDGDAHACYASTMGTSVDVLHGTARKIQRRFRKRPMRAAAKQLPAPAMLPKASANHRPWKDAADFEA